MRGAIEHIGRNCQKAEQYYYCNGSEHLSRNCLKNPAIQTYRGENAKIKAHRRSNNDSKGNDEFAVVSITSAMITTDEKATLDKHFFDSGATSQSCNYVAAYYTYEPGTGLL